MKGLVRKTFRWNICSRTNLFIKGIELVQS